MKTRIQIRSEDYNCKSKSLIIEGFNVDEIFNKIKFLFECFEKAGEELTIKFYNDKNEKDKK